MKMAEEATAVVNRDNGNSFTMTMGYGEREARRRCALAGMYALYGQNGRNRPETH